mmetsp:Transcript_25773/g.52752  ORF Transcript_25773/g.52752 Transcript_25773/m.52752 type:complete len:244 (+) Transcript_25773:1242-1973(+)
MKLMASSSQTTLILPRQRMGVSHTQYSILTDTTSPRWLGILTTSSSSHVMHLAFFPQLPSSALDRQCTTSSLGTQQRLLALNGVLLSPLPTSVHALVLLSSLFTQRDMQTSFSRRLRNTGHTHGSSILVGLVVHMVWESACPSRPQEAALMPSLMAVPKKHPQSRMRFLALMCPLPCQMLTPRSLIPSNLGRILMNMMLLPRSLLACSLKTLRSMRIRDLPTTLNLDPKCKFESQAAAMEPCT